MNTDLELENIVDEMIQEGILDRVKARTTGALAGAKQMGQNIKGVFTGGPIKGYGQQYGEVKFNNRINQFLKQAQKDLDEFEAKYGADLSNTKMPEEAKATASAQIAAIKTAIATAQQAAGGTKAPAAQQAQKPQTPPSAGSEAGSTTPATGTPAPQSAVPSPAGQIGTQQQAGGTPATAPNVAAWAGPPHDYDAEEAAKTKNENFLYTSYSRRGPYSYLIEQPQQKASKADIDKQIASMFAKIIQKLKAKPDDKELLGLLQKLSKTTDPKVQYQILSASKRLNEHLERIAEREAKLLEEGEFTDSLKANIAGAKAGIGAVRSNLRNYGKEGPNQNAMSQAKTAKEQALINAPINNLKTKIGKNLAELNRDLKTLGFNKADDKRFEPIKKSLGTLQQTLSDQQFGEVKTKLGDIRHGIGTFVGGAIKNSVIGAGLASAIASGGVANPYAAKAIAGAATSVIRDISKGNFKKDDWKGILKRAAVGAGIGLAVQFGKEALDIGSMAGKELANFKTNISYREAALTKLPEELAKKAGMSDVTEKFIRYRDSFVSLSEHEGIPKNFASKVFSMFSKKLKDEISKPIFQGQADISIDSSNIRGLMVGVLDEFKSSGASDESVGAASKFLNAMMDKAPKSKWDEYVKQIHDLVSSVVKGTEDGQAMASTISSAEMTGSPTADWPEGIPISNMSGRRVMASFHRK